MNIDVIKKFEIKLTAEAAAKKFFLRELFLFFIDKREEVFGDAPLQFSVDDFSLFLEKKKIKRVMSSTLNKDFIKAHLEVCKLINKRNRNLRVIYPIEPILKYRIKGDIFEVDCPTDYFDPIVRWITKSVKDGDFEDKKRSFFRYTKDHKIAFQEKTTKGHLELKERGIFGTLVNNFNRPCTYGELYESVERMFGSKSDKKAKLKVDVISNKEKKQYIDDGIQAMRKKLYELSGKPDTIRAVRGRKSEYILTY